MWRGPQSSKETSIFEAITKVKVIAHPCENPFKLISFFSAAKFLIFMNIELKFSYILKKY